MRKLISTMTAVLLLCFGTTAVGQTDITPSHVFQLSEELVAEIELLREELGVRDYPPDPELQEDRSPVHVYAKSLEVLLKLIWVEQKYGIAPSPLGQIPIKAVVPEDVMMSVGNLLEETRRIKAALLINKEINKPAYVKDKTPSEVYNNISLASSLLDGVVGRSLSLNDVYRNTQYVEDEMMLIAKHLKVRLITSLPTVNQRRFSKDIAQQVYLAVNRIVDLQERLKMNASSVPNLTMVRITPSEVYDATTALLAELVRIKHHLKINEPLKERILPFGKKPRDVYASMRLINRNLDLLNDKIAHSWR